MCPGCGWDPPQQMDSLKDRDRESDRLKEEERRAESDEQGSPCVFSGILRKGPNVSTGESAQSLRWLTKQQQQQQQRGVVCA